MHTALGNPLHVGVKMVAYCGNFGCFQRPKSAGDRERVMIKLNEIILYYDLYKLKKIKTLFYNYSDIAKHYVLDHKLFFLNCIDAIFSLLGDFVTLAINWL
jgi:hypothetical protein